MAVKVSIVPVTPYQQNCSIIQCTTTGKAAVVDPGGDLQRIVSTLEQMSAQIEKVI